MVEGKNIAEIGDGEVGELAVAGRHVGMWVGPLSVGQISLGGEGLFS